jgi:hypothetical protein
MEREDKTDLITLAIIMVPVVLIIVGVTLDSLIGHC